MKHTLLILPSLLWGALAAPVAMAEDVSGTATAPLTRAEVKAEAKRAEAAGEIPKGDVVVPPALEKMPPSTTTRAEVRAELEEARARGEIPQGEIPTPPFLPK